MQQSNGYVIGYAAGLTIVCALLLALAATGLKAKQEENIQLEMKKNILATVMTLDEQTDVKSLYAKRVKSYVVDANGDVVEGVKPETLASTFVADEYKKPMNERRMPVYEIVSESDPNKAEFYVLPVYGYGLWNYIWGYVSLEGDLATIKGVKFEHLGETPGLGARIATTEIQERYTGKKIADGDKVVSVVMVKGESGGGNASIAAYKDKAHEVDGMSGATITAKGLNNMLSQYFTAYEGFIKAKKGKLSLNQ